MAKHRNKPGRIGLENHVFAAKARPLQRPARVLLFAAIMRDFLNKHLWIVAACTGGLLIAILSLVPGYLRPHIGAPGSVEHFIAYLLVAGAFAKGLRSERSILLMVVGLSLAAPAR